MLRMIYPISALLVGVGLLLLGAGLLNTLLVLRAELENYSSASIGLIMSGYFLGFFIGTYLALPLVSRIGHIRAFAFCASLISSLVLVHALWVDSVVWFLMRVITGAALVILYTIIESWLNGLATSQNRGKLFAIYMTVNLGALALAQQLLRADSTLSFILFSLSSILISVSLIPVTWTRLKQPELHQVVRLPMKKLHQIAPVALLASLLSGLAMGAFWGLGALYASKMGLTTGQVAMFISCTVLGGALLQFPIGRWSDKLDRRLLLAYISIAAGVIALVVIPVTAATGLLFLVIALYGGLAFAIYPVAIAHLVDHLKPEQMLAGGSSLLLLHGVGAMIGPLVAGQLMELPGPLMVPLFWSVIHLVLGFMALSYRRHGAEEDPGAHVADFVPMVRTTPMAFELLPAEETANQAEASTQPTWGTLTDSQQPESPAGETSDLNKSEFDHL